MADGRPEEQGDGAESARRAELQLCRELHGIFQSLATRPISEGNDGAVLGALRDVQALMAELDGLPRALLPEQRLRALKSMADQLPRLPPQTVARSLVRGLEDLLADVASPDLDYPLAFHASPTGKPALRALAVQVGPSIGVGDELLLGRALVERARALGEVTLHASSRRPDLWACLGKPVQLLPGPPLGAQRYLETLPPQERSGVGYLYLDFLRSDPMPGLEGAVPALPLLGRWFMGPYEGERLDVGRPMRYALRAPWGLPGCRWLESRWMAAHMLPGAGASGEGDEGLWREPVFRDGPIALQGLTSKPRLMLPGSFYREVFARLKALLGHSPRVLFLPAPTEKGRALLEDLHRGVREVLGPEAVEDLPPQSLSQVYRLLAGASALAGPDTFSAHMAGLLALPQVTLTLPEHTGWLSLGAPCLWVPPLETPSAFAAAVASRLHAFLVLAREPAEPALQEGGRKWRHHMRRVDAQLRAWLWGQPPRVAELREDLHAVQRLYLRHAEAVARRLQVRYAEAKPAFCTFEPSVYDTEEESVLASARWYQAVCLTDVSGVLTAVPAR